MANAASWDQVEYDVMMMGALSEEEFYERDRPHDLLPDLQEEEGCPVGGTFLVDVRTGREIRLS